MKRRFFGIDFSGNHAMWSARCTRSNVWIAEVHARARKLSLVDLRRVRDLDGEGPPLARLAALLRRGDFAAAGIDAPFALPARFMPKTSDPHATLLARVARIPRGDRPFPRGDDFVRAITGSPSTRLDPPKPLRATELEWMRRRVNVRSPLWCGARPGAPMTAACLTLLHEAKRPIWPWSREPNGLLCEAFPSAQAHVWREAGVELAARIDLGAHASTIARSDDARDAVLAAFGAIAIANDRLVSTPDARIARIEGWVAVHA